jgi:8-oxo-dGTP diphosphatase
MKIIEASLVYLFRDDKCLMLHRIKKENDLHKGKWNGLGGKSEPCESPEECALREIKEESGYKINKLTFAGHLYFPSFDNDKNDWSVFVFTSNDFGGEQLESTNEGELKWVPKNQLLDLNLWEGDHHFLPLLLSGRTFLGKFTYKNKYLIDYKLSQY